MKSKKAIVLLSAIIVFSCALRAPITGVGSLIGYISDDLSLSNMSAGMLTTIPLMAFSAVSFFIGSFSHRLGAGKVLLTGIILLFVGIILRSFANISGLFVGTAVIGLGIAVGNVQRIYDHHVGLRRYFRGHKRTYCKSFWMAICLISMDYPCLCCSYFVASQ